MKYLNKKAFSVIEYAVLFVIIIGGFVVMKDYMQRGIFGTWGQTGQSYAFGRQYDSEKTIECAYDDQVNVWYDHNCFESLMNNKGCFPGDSVCEGIIKSGSCGASGCSGTGPVSTPPPVLCTPTTCTPNHQCGSAIGTDNCGNSCSNATPGTCPPSQTCNSSFQCSNNCTPNCEGHACGLDPVCGTLDCGRCVSGTCNTFGQCTVGACAPNSQVACGSGTCAGGTRTCNSGGTGYSNCSTAGAQCHAATSCTLASSCNVLGLCPATTNLPDGTICGRNMICTSGLCVGSGAINGGWTAWSCGTCSANGTCATNGLKACTRTCTNPAPANGGANCSGLDGGNSSEQQACTGTPPASGTGFQSIPNGHLNPTWSCCSSNPSCCANPAGTGANCSYVGPAPGFPGICQTNLGTCTCDPGYVVQTNGGCICGAPHPSTVAIVNGTVTETWSCGTCSSNPGSNCSYTNGPVTGSPGICQTNTCTCNDGKTPAINGGC